MKIMRNLSAAERTAAGAALCIAACAAGSTIGMSNDDVRTMDRLSTMAAKLLLSSGLTPTEIKDLGMEIIGTTVEQK